MVYHSETSNQILHDVRVVKELFQCLHSTIVVKEDFFNSATNGWSWIDDAFRISNKIGLPVATKRWTSKEVSPLPNCFRIGLFICEIHELLNLRPTF